MKESYKEDLASNFGLELYADDGNVVAVATAANTHWLAIESQQGLIFLTQSFR